MKKLKFNKRNFISRIIMFPFFAAIILFVYVKLYLYHIFTFFWCGGEVIVYNDGINPNTILDSVYKIEEILKNENLK